MSNTLIVGDLHLGKGLTIGRPGFGLGLNSRIADQFKLLDWVLEQALQRHVSVIIFTGDIFEDVKPDYILSDALIQWLKKCETENIDVHIIAGNHDIKRSGGNYFSPLNLIQSSEIENTTVHKQVDTIYNGTVGFTLFPFRDRRSFNCNTTTEAIAKVEELLSWEVTEIPDTYDKVLIGHLAIEGSIFVGDEIEDIANELMCPPMIFNGYHHVWMGHVHKPQIHRQKPHVAHIGSLDISDFGETDHQKILIHYDSKMPGKFETIPVPSRPLRRVKITVPEFADVNQTIADELQKMNKLTPLNNAIVKLEVQLTGTDANADRGKVEKLLQEYGAFHVSSFTESRMSFVIPEDKRKNLDNTIEPKQAVRMFVMDSKEISLESEEDRAILLQMCNEIIEEHQQGEK